jgi:hypothetical protein
VVHMQTANSSSRTFVLCGYRIGGTLAHAVANVLAPAVSLTRSKESAQTSFWSQHSNTLSVVSVAFGAPQGFAGGFPEEVIVRHQRHFSLQL